MTESTRVLAVDIFQEVSRWHQNAVEPTHVVMSWETVELLASQSPEPMSIGRQTPHVWGFPIVIAPGLPAGVWAVATTHLDDADTMQRAIR